MTKKIKKTENIDLFEDNSDDSGLDGDRYQSIETNDPLMDEWVARQAKISKLNVKGKELEFQQAIKDFEAWEIQVGLASPKK